MPVVRPAGVPTTNGHTSIHSPGVYEAILRKRCEQTDYLSMPEVLLVEDVAADLAAWERDKEQRVAALMAERYGPTLNVNSADLPPGLPPPFDMKWSRGRGFTVTPDDEITLRAFGPWR